MPSRRCRWFAASATLIGAFALAACGSDEPLEVDAASFDSSASIEGFDESAIARIDTDGDGRVDAIVVLAIHAAGATVLEFVDRTDDPDIELFEAMVDTLVVLE